MGRTNWLGLYIYIYSQAMYLMTLIYDRYYGSPKTPNEFWKRGLSDD